MKWLCQFGHNWVFTRITLPRVMFCSRCGKVANR
jgi:hypothetical protein